MNVFFYIAQARSLINELKVAIIIATLYLLNQSLQVNSLYEVKDERVFLNLPGYGKKLDQESEADHEELKKSLVRHAQEVLDHGLGASHVLDQSFVALQEILDLSLENMLVTEDSRSQVSKLFSTSFF